MSHTFSATGGEAPYTYDVTSGAGSIDASSGVYTAGPTAGATTVRVSDHGGHTAAAAVTINGALGLNPSPATVAAGATLMLTPSGGTAPYTLALIAGDGSFDSTTHIYTAPAATGTATVSVKDSLGTQATVVVNINSGLVAGAPSFTLTASSGQTYPIPVSGGTSPLTYSVTSGTGTVDGTGVYTAGTKIGYDEVQVTDAHGVTSNVRIRLLEALTNGQILSMASDDSGTYVGGIFSAVHPHVTARMAALDPTSGKLNLRCDVASGFDAATAVMLVVGNSLYVGGPFTHYQGRPAHALVKLDATTCALDPQFTQATGFDGFVSPASVGLPKKATVFSLATDGTSLFVGGDFSSYRGQPAFGLAKLDLATGNLDPTFTQSIGFNNAVSELAASADALYVYGHFSSYRGTNTTNSVPLKLNSRTGNIDPTFHTSLSEYDTIICMVLSGASVYIGGDYPAAVIKLDAATGATDQVFQANVSNIQQQVFALAVSGASLYVGGLSVAAIPGHIAKLDANTGKADPAFNRADTTASSTIHSLALSGNSLYIAGVSKFGDQDVPGGVAKLDAMTGNLDTSFGDGESFAGGGPTAVLASGDTLYLAGTMVTYGGIPAQNVAKFDPTTWVADSRFLSAGGAENAVTKIISSGSSLYVAGGFSTFGGVHAPVLAKVDPVTGMADSQFSRGAGFEGELNQVPGLTGSVQTLALSGNSLFVGGVFQYYRGLPLVALAKIDALTGDVDTTFNQPTGFTGTPGAGSGAYNTASVSALALSGSSIYVSGTYTAYRGTPTFILSKLDATSGALDAHFVTYTGMVFVLPYSEIDFNVILPAGNSLYVGGGSLPVPGGPNNMGLYGVGKFDATTGAPDMTFISAGGVAPNGSSTPLVFDLVLSGTSLYIGGDFTAHNSNNFARLDAVSGLLDTPFTQEPGANDRVYSIAQSGNSLRVSGAFTTYGGSFEGYSMAIDPVSGSALTP
jgi:hypothetical protein